MLTADRLKYKWYKKRTGTIWAPGIKMWSNGIPLKADTYQSCMNFCKYCYAEELRKGILARVGMAQDSRVSRMLDVAWLAKFFEKAYQHDDKSPFMNWSIRNKYFIEVGTTGETFQEADTYFRTTYNFLKLTSYYKMPLFINTKMNLLCNNEQYFNMLRDYPAPVIICLTLTTTDDEDGRKFEPGAPLPSERLRVIKELSKHNVSTIVYTSPYMPGVTDKDMDKYAGDLLDAGIVGVHLRDFFVQGDRFKNSFWQEYMKLNKQHYAPFPGGHHVKYSRRRWFMEELQKRVEKRDPNFKVVGVKSAWFELNPFHGKMCYDYLPEDFKKGITDWTAIPMMRKIRDNVNTPQLLLWEKLGYKRNMINYPEYIRTNEGDINNLTVGRCNCSTASVELEIEGYDWLVHGLWDGFDEKEPCGFFSELKHIYPVKDGKSFYKVDGKYVYAYVPENMIVDHVRSDRTAIGFIKPDVIEGGYVDLSKAKDFMIPERLGGTEDKFLVN